VGFNIRYADNNYSLYNFTNQTNVASAYGMAKFDFNVGDVRVRANAGLRYENASNKVTALDRLKITGSVGLPSDFAEHVYKQSYGKLLPSFIVAADLAKNVILRGAAYRTYVRPQPRQFTPATIVGTPSNGVYTLTLGNPNLRPYDATSLDVSLEYYNRPGGIISVAAFQKRITGLIANITDPKQLCPSDATAYGLGTLTLNGDVCQSSLIYTGGATHALYHLGFGLREPAQPGEGARR
jgi:TonB-dependent receptor